MSHQTQNVITRKSNTQSGFGHDSLRFSYDFNRESSASSFEGKQIQFQFEEYPEHEFQADVLEKQKNNSIDCSNNSNATRKLGIFNKYRHTRQSTLQNANDIGQSFDKIFNKDKNDDITTKYFSKKQQRQQKEKPKNNSKQTEVFEPTNQTNKKQQENDIFDNIIDPHESRQKPTLQQTNNHQSFDPFSQSYLKQQNSIHITDKETQSKAKLKQQSNSSTNQVSKSNIKQILNSQSNQSSSPISNKKDPQFILNQANQSSIKDNFIIQQNSNNQNNESKQVHNDGKNSQTQNQQIFINSEQTTNSTDSSIILSQPLYEQQQRVVSFLRQIRKMNSIYPNFNHPNINLSQEQKFCNSLACLFDQALKTLQKIVLFILEKWHKPRFFPQQFRCLQYFTTSGWQIQKEKQWDLINSKIKPMINVTKSSINEGKIMKALMNYKEVIEYYKQKKIQLNSEEGIKNYFKIRQKFWQLEKNIRGISQDIYQVYPSTHYPQFYFNYLRILKSHALPNDQTNTIEYFKNIYDLLIANQQNNEPLSMSAVGEAVKMRIQKEVNF